MNITIKDIKIFVSISFLFFLCIKTQAQQRQLIQIEEIIRSKQNQQNTNLDYLEKTNSSALFDSYNLGKNCEAFYIYNSVDKKRKSFYIVSGDKRMPSILAYSDFNSFDVEHIPSAVKYWLESYVQEYKSLTESQYYVPSKGNIPYNSDGVSPLLGSIQWSQETPYNNYCPTYMGDRTVTGCVATAMAQVMKYYSYPEQGKGYVSYSTDTHGITINHNFADDNFDWSNMLDTYTGSYSNLQATAVATLMFSCGASVKMDYGRSGSPDYGSGAYQSDLLNGYIENFGYDNDAALVVRNYCSTEDWHKMLVEELNAGRPVNYGGHSIQDGGHSFVLDGYKISENTYPDYHVNWGWNGSCDGYYQIADLHPQEGGTYYTTDGFSESQQMTIGIKPDDSVSDNKHILCSSKINNSLSKVKIGSDISFNVSSLYNCSYKKFTGVISVALENDSNKLVVLGNGKKYQLEYLEGTGSVSYSFTIPNSINCGKYKCVLVYQISDSNEWSKILSSSYPQIEVTENEEEKPSEETWSEIGCSEFELLQKSDRSVIYANVYELINLKTDAFVGSISLTLADENGSPIYKFGDNVEIPELGYNDYLTEYVSVSGSLTKPLSDGYYRLYLSCKKKNQTSDSYVVQNNLEIPGSQTKELYYPVRIKDGIVYIDGKEYIITPTSIDNISNFNSDCPTIYNLSGIKIGDNPTSNIYLLNTRGKTKKFVFLH